MSRYYIKKLRFQELGSPKFVKGVMKCARGRYIYISKDHGGFFPHLSTVVLNDKTVIAFKMPFSDDIIYGTFGYHNSKYIETAPVDGDPRNELRIYLNSQLSDNKAYFRPGEIVVFEKMQDENEGFVYYNVNIFNNEDEHYLFLDRLIPRRKGFCLYNDPIDFISPPARMSGEAEEVSEEVISVIGLKQEEVISGLLQEKEESQSEPSEKEMGADLFNARSFHDFVMNAYLYRCAVTREVIRCQNLMNLEAAHIKPQAHEGSFLPCNGIALSRDMHFAFDKGFFTIDEYYRVKVHPLVLETDSYLNKYEGCQIYIPTVDFFKPNEMFLQHHRKHIYGSFKQIRRIS